MRCPSIWCRARATRALPAAGLLPALKHLDYLTINELEASEFSGLEIRLPNGEPHVANIARAASALLDAGVRQRGSDPLSGRGHGASPVPKPGAGVYRHGGYRRRRLSAASARGRLLRRSAVWQSRTLAVNRQSAAGSRLRPRQPAGRQCDRRRQKRLPELQAFIQLQNV